MNQKYIHRDLRRCRQLVQERMEWEKKFIISCTLNNTPFPIDKNTQWLIDTHRHIYFAYNELLKIIDNKIAKKEGGAQ